MTPPVDDKVLGAVDIAKRFGSVVALAGVDLAVAPGEVVALAGENGSGKSTLAKVLAGALRPDGGTLYCDGREVRFAGPRHALDAGVTLVSQEPTLVPPMTVAENVLLHRLRRAGQPVRRRDLAREAAAALARVGAEVDPSLPVAALPSGAREMVELAKALASDPRVLILDEVTTRLPDPEAIFGVIEEQCRAGLGVVLITHRLREIARLADRAVVLRDGAVVAELRRDELDDARLSAAMVGRPLSDLYAKPPVVIGEPILEVDALEAAGLARPVTLCASAGEILGVAGLVGCGRNELLEAIGGVRRAGGGTVRVRGRDVTPRHPRDAIRAGIGLVPDDRWAQGLLPTQSLEANLALCSHRTLRRTRRSLDRDRARRVIDHLAIRAPSAEVPVATLSGGNAQKVLLGRVLDLEPSVLLLNEPTRGVDIGAKADIYRIIDDLVASGTSVVLSSSDLLELIGLCDRILVMHDGAVVGELDGAEATEEVITLMMGGGVPVP